MQIPVSLFGIAVALGLGACASQQSSPESAPEQASARQEQPLASDASEATYHAMLGEIALQREMYDTAVNEFRRAAELSTDPDLIERAINGCYLLRAGYLVRGLLEVEAPVTRAPRQPQAPYPPQTANTRPAPPRPVPPRPAPPRC